MGICFIWTTRLLHHILTIIEEENRQPSSLRHVLCFLLNWTHVYSNMFIGPLLSNTGIYIVSSEKDAMSLKILVYLAQCPSLLQHCSAYTRAAIPTKANVAFVCVIIIKSHESRWGDGTVCMTVRTSLGMYVGTYTFRVSKIWLSINMAVCSFSHSSFKQGQIFFSYGSRAQFWALAASMKLSISFQLLDLGQSAGLLGRVISSSQGLC
jgi:hypothetical protein